MGGGMSEFLDEQPIGGSGGSGMGGMSEFPDESAPLDVVLLPCPNCGRKFNEKALAVRGACGPLLPLLLRG